MAAINQTIINILDQLELVYDYSDKKTYVKDLSTYDGRLVCRCIGDTETNGFIFDTIYNETGLIITSSNEKEVNRILHQQAINDGLEEKVYKRFFNTKNLIYINLGKGRLLGINKTKIQKFNNKKTCFMENKLFEAIAKYDIENGDVNVLSNHINVTEEEYKLIVVFMINMFFHNNPQLILMIIGPAGSSKSTLQFMIQQLVDPSILKNQNQPSKVNNLIMAASNSYLLSFNNVGYLDAKTQNALCTIATGGVDADKDILTNSNHQIFITKNPVMINALVNPATQEDLLQRSLIINLPPILDEHRQTETEVKDNFKKDLAIIRGGLYKVVQGVLAIRESFERPTALNRMADFTLLGYKVEEVLKWPKGSFEAAYDLNLSISRNSLIQESEVAQAIILMSQNSEFKGTMTEFLLALNAYSKIQITSKKLGVDIDKVSDALLALHGIKIIRLPRSGGKNILSVSRSNYPEDTT